jgi:Recombination endonuclease VII
LAVLEQEHATTDVERALPVPVVPATKRCTLCGVEKPLGAYGKQKGGRYGLHPRCKECRQKAERARYAAKREQILEQQRTSAARAAYRKGIWRRRAYGITHDEFRAMVETQGGRCALGHELRASDELVVDHDHDSGAIRGLLCRLCNVGLGAFRDDPTFLRAGAEYLESRPHTPGWMDRG